jgi:hypothetical protein
MICTAHQCCASQPLALQCEDGSFGDGNGSVSAQPPEALPDSPLPEQIPERLTGEHPVAIADNLCRRTRSVPELIRG